MRTQRSNQSSLQNLWPLGEPVAGVGGIIRPAGPLAAAAAAAAAAADSTAAACLLLLLVVLRDQVCFGQQLGKLLA
jgi:hypothetical protein